MVCFVHFTSKRASRHNCEHFFISHLARRLRTRRFSEPTFRPSGATNHWKNTVFRDFPTFSRIWASFFWLFLFYSSLLSDSSRLCFSSVHIVRSLTSKLPSSIYTDIFLNNTLWTFFIILRCLIKLSPWHCRLARTSSWWQITSRRATKTWWPSPTRSGLAVYKNVFSHCCHISLTGRNSTDLSRGV